MALLERAEQMEAEGAESEAIRKATGWFKSFDGEWRYEIDDSRMRYLNPTPDAEGFTTLGELIEHDALFAAYPQLRELKVEFKADTKYNYYSPGRKKIVLMETVFEDGDFKKSQDKKLSGKTILIHEIQHAIQHIEGFARGTSPQEWRQVLRERRKKVGVHVKGKTKKAVQRITEKYGDEVGQDARRYIDLAILEGRDKITKAELEELDVIEFDLEMILGEDFDIIDKALIEEAEYINSLRSIKGDAELDYYNTAGEIEAYDVGERVDLDEEARRQVRPDIDRNPDEVKFADPNSWRKMHSEDAGEKKITAGMSEEERYEILKDKRVVLKDDDNVQNIEYSKEIHSIEELNKKARSKATDIIVPLAKRLGILERTFKTPEVDVEFIFSKNKGLLESTVKQLRYGGDYSDFAKALVKLDDILESAVLIEVHKDKYIGTERENPNLDSVYVLLSAFKDGKNIIPVQLEIKKFHREGGRLYVMVALTKIEADVLGSANDENVQARSLISASTYSIADIIKNVNPNDGHFLKYLSDKFLTEEQIQAKKLAIKEDNERIGGYSSAKKKIQYSRKMSDNSGSERKVLLPVLNRERFKIYTQENAEQIVSSIVHNVLRFNDGTQGVINNKSELIDMLWRRLNTADPSKRGAVALEIAEEIIQRTAVRTVLMILLMLNTLKW